MCVSYNCYGVMGAFQNWLYVFCVLSPGIVITVRKNDSQQSLLINVDVEPTSTVADVKRCIGHMQSGNLSPEINLQFNGKLLQDEHTLRDYGVGPLSTLLLSEIFLVYVTVIRRESRRSTLISVKVLSTDSIDDIISQVNKKVHLHHFPVLYSDGLSRISSQLISECNIQNGSLVRLEGKVIYAHFCQCFIIILQLQKK